MKITRRSLLAGAPLAAGLIAAEGGRTLPVANLAFRGLVRGNECACRRPPN